MIQVHILDLEYLFNRTNIYFVCLFDLGFGNFEPLRIHLEACTVISSGPNVTGYWIDTKWKIDARQVHMLDVEYLFNRTNIYFFVCLIWGLGTLAILRAHFRVLCSNFPKPLGYWTQTYHIKSSESDPPSLFDFIWSSFITG